MAPWLAWVFIAFLVIIIIISAIVVFNPVLNPYLPGQPDSGGNNFLISVKNFVYSEKFLGAVLLLVLAAITSWVLLKKK